MQQKKIILEVMYKADYCLPCFYMDETVRQILPKYEEYVEYRRIDFLKDPGRKRFLELSFQLFGEEAVKKYCRLAPVPSLFINGELFFDQIPPLFDLEEAIQEAIKKMKKKLHIEVIHEGPHCMPCEYMAKVVESVAGDYPGILTWEKVIITKKEGAFRFDELSGKLGRLPPVPSIFINGELAFDITPGIEELKEHIDRLLS